MQPSEFTCYIVFYVQPSDFFGLFKVGRHVNVCINYNIIVGLCSELFVRLSYYITVGYGKKL